MRELIVDGVRPVDDEDWQMLILLEKWNKEPAMAMRIGVAEASEIYRANRGVVSPRPTTAELLWAFVRAAYRVVRVEIVDMVDNTYIASIVVALQGRQIMFDARPSDAIALAIRMTAPIYIREDVLARARVLFHVDTGQAVEVSSVPEEPSAFKDFINSLDLDDFKGIQ